MSSNASRRHLNRVTTGQGQCPICGRSFRMDMLGEHADLCAARLDAKRPPAPRPPGVGTCENSVPRHGCGGMPSARVRGVNPSDRCHRLSTAAPKRPRAPSSRPAGGERSKRVASPATRRPREPRESMYAMDTVPVDEFEFRCQAFRAQFGRGKVVPDRGGAAVNTSAGTARSATRLLPLDSSAEASSSRSARPSEDKATRRPRAVTGPAAASTSAGATSMPAAAGGLPPAPGAPPAGAATAAPAPGPAPAPAPAPAPPPAPAVAPAAAPAGAAPASGSVAAVRLAGIGLGSGSGYGKIGAGTSSEGTKAAAPVKQAFDDANLETDALAFLDSVRAVLDGPTYGQFMDLLMAFEGSTCAARSLFPPRPSTPLHAVPRPIHALYAPLLRPSTPFYALPYALSHPSSRPSTLRSRPGWTQSR